MIVDVATFVGPYPFRELPNTSPEGLLREMDRVGVDRAWVGYLPAYLHSDPAPGNEVLVKAVATHDRLAPVPTIDVGLPDWKDDVANASRVGAVAVRTYPVHQGVPPGGSQMQELVVTAGAAGLPVVLTVRFEDLRQRHPIDTAPDFPPSAVRQLARCGSDVRLVITHAGREFVEEVHFGLTMAEQARVWFDISWLWGPPSDDLDMLCQTVGADRFVWGSGAPLRIMDAPSAKLDLAHLSPGERRAIESDNLSTITSRLP